MTKKTLIEGNHLKLIMERLGHQIVEEHDDLSNTCVLGIQSRGVLFSDRLVPILKNISGNKDIKYGKVDITFFRDDFNRHDNPLMAAETDIDFSIENKDIILVDDILFSGRTIRAALTGILQYGRPKSIELLVLVDRRFHRDLPIEANYIGYTLDAVDEAYVSVDWKPKLIESKVVIYPNKPQN